MANARRLTREDVFSAADKLAGKGLSLNAARLHAELGRGSMATIQKHLEDWRLRNDPAAHDQRPLPAELTRLGKRIMQDAWELALEAADQRLEAIERDSLRQVELAKADLAREIDRCIAAEHAAESAEMRATQATAIARSHETTVSELLEVHDALQSKLRSSHEELSSCRKALGQQTREQERLSKIEAAQAKQIKALTEGRDKLTQQRDRLTDQLEVRDGREADLTKYIDRLEKQLDSAHGQADRLQAELQAEQRAQQRLRDDSDAAHRESEHLRGELGTLKTRYDAAMEKIDTAQRDLREAQEELKVLNRELQESRQSEAELRGRISVHAELMQSLEKELSKAHLRIQELEGDGE